MAGGDLVVTVDLPSAFVVVDLPRRPPPRVRDVDRRPTRPPAAAENGSSFRAGLALEGAELTRLPRSRVQSSHGSRVSWELTSGVRQYRGFNAFSFGIRVRQCWQIATKAGSSRLMSTAG